MYPVGVAKWVREDCVVAVKAVSDASSSVTTVATIFECELFLNLGVLFISIFLVINKADCVTRCSPIFAKHWASIGVVPCGYPQSTISHTNSETEFENKQMIAICGWWSCADSSAF